MSDGNGTSGGYITRGRAGELERMILETEQRLGTRLDELEAELIETRRLARASLAAPVAFAKGQIGGLLEALRDYTGG